MVAIITAVNPQKNEIFIAKEAPRAQISFDSKLHVEESFEL